MHSVYFCSYLLKDSVTNIIHIDYSEITVTVDSTPKNREVCSIKKYSPKNNSFQIYTEYQIFAKTVTIYFLITGMCK